MNKASIASIIIILAAGVFYFTQPKQPKISDLTPQGQNTEEQIISNTQDVKIEILQEGEGEETKTGDRITVDYMGMFENGEKFDSSIDRGQPFIFTLGQGSVIQGWELGVIGMKIGEKRKLTIPPELAYGDRGAGEIIPPNSTLIFEIDLLKIN